MSTVPPDMPPVAGAPPPPPASGGTQTRNRVLWVIAAVVVVGAAVIAAILLTGNDAGEKKASKEVLTEPISSTGANPFTPKTGTDYANMPAVTDVGHLDAAGRSGRPVRRYRESGIVRQDAARHVPAAEPRQGGSVGIDAGDSND